MEKRREFMNIDKLTLSRDDNYVGTKNDKKVIEFLFLLVIVLLIKSVSRNTYE